MKKTQTNTRSLHIIIRSHHVCREAAKCRGETTLRRGTKRSMLVQISLALFSFLEKPLLSDTGKLYSSGGRDVMPAWISQELERTIRTGLSSSSSPHRDLASIAYTNVRCMYIYTWTPLVSFPLPAPLYPRSVRPSVCCASSTVGSKLMQERLRELPARFECILRPCARRRLVTNACEQSRGEHYIGGWKIIILYYTLNHCYIRENESCYHNTSYKSS